MMYTQIGDLLAFLKRKQRFTRSTASRSNVRFILDVIKEWGDHTVIYNEEFLRNQQSEVLSRRLAQPYKHVHRKMERCFRLSQEYIASKKDENSRSQKV